MYDKRLTRIAHSYPLRFGILDNPECHVEISALVNIHMAVACSSLNDRYGGVLYNELYKPLAASRYNHIDILIHREKLFYALPVG